MTNFAWFLEHPPRTKFCCTARSLGIEWHALRPCLEGEASCDDRKGFSVWLSKFLSESAVERTKLAASDLFSVNGP